MSFSIKKKKLVSYSVLSAGFSLILAIGLVVHNQNSINVFGNNVPEYSITLDSTNKVTSNGDHIMKTALGNDVTFTYSNAANSTTGHVTFSNGGVINNKDHIRSIKSITATFNAENSLSFKTSYDNSTWGGVTSMVSGYKYNLGSDPYYFYISASKTVTISSLVVEFSCQANEAANGHEVIEEGDSYYQKVTTANSFNGETYLFVQEEKGLAFNGNLLTYDVVNNVIDVTIVDDKISSTVAIDQAAFTIDKDFNILSSTGYYIYNDSDSNALKASVTVPDYSNSIIVSDGVADVVCSSSHLRYNPGTSNQIQNRFRYYKSASYTNQEEISLYKKVVVAGGSHTEFDTPEESIIGFTAVDSKKNDYKTTDIYDNVNGLSVVANYTGGTTTPLAKGGDDGYSYTIHKQGSDVNINTAEPFGGDDDGVYILVVTYKNFIPQEIELSVGFVVALTNITVNSSILTYNTAQTIDLSAVTVDLTYNKSSMNVQGVAYSAFGEYGLTLSLLNPNDVVSDTSVAFGTNGTWKIKVSNSTGSVYGTVDITVNAIPVATISINGDSATVEEGKTIQLTVGVTPNNATNKTVTWSSEDETVATVDNSGVVTGVTAGQTNIRATATDGSSVYGTYAITVTEKITDADEGLFQLNETNSLEVGSYIVFTSPSSENSAYAMSSTQSTNNRTGVTVDVDNGTLERTADSTFAAFRVEAGTQNGSYSFYDEDSNGYLCAVGGGNYLRTESEKSVNSSFTVSGTTGKTIVSLASVDQKYMRWNSTSSLFSCYKSNSTVSAQPYIYQKDGNPVYATSIKISGDSTVGVGSTSQLSVAYTPTNTTIKSVTWSTSNDTIVGVSDTGLLTGIKAGTATITAKVKGENNVEISDTLNVTVSNVSVSSVSLNKSATSLYVGDDEQLTATISPSNATNKNVTWSTSDNSVAIVSDGLVTAKSKGSAVITVTTADGNKTASCTVTVSASVAAEDTYVIGLDDFNTTSYSSNDGSHSSTSTSSSSTLSWVSSNVYKNNTSGTLTIQFKNSPTGYIYNSSAVALNTITINGISAGTFTVYGGTSSSHPTSTSITPSSGVYNLSGYTYFTITGSGTAKCTSIYITTGESAPVDPTGISVTPTTAELYPNGSKTLDVSYTPNNANQNLAVTWTSSNTNVATVDTSGKVTATSSATAGQTAIITARLKNLTSIYATCTITIVEKGKADHTVLIYICGADLESDSSYRLATGDISEMLSVSGQPDDVNVVIETGGAKSWATTYGISSTYLQRHHIANKKLVTDSSLTYASMGLSSTLQSFVEYGINNYPANRYGLILWNHGGGMRGVCYDEKKSDDSLLDYEVKNAVSNALSNTGESKLEWIGYDACLMQVQDIAEMNSQYANYMVASEESEAGYGWDYDTWFDDLYAKKPTTTILKAIVDGFIADNGGTNSYSNDQTLSYLDLSYASAYKTAWENMANVLYNKLSSSNKSSFNNLVKGCKYYADTDYTYFGLFDAKDFINKLSNNSTFNPGSSYTSAVLTAHGNLVAYSSCGRGAGNSYGLAMYWSAASDSGKSSIYTSSHTNFTKWRSIVSTYGA